MALQQKITAWLDRIEDSTLSHRLTGHRLRINHEARCLTCNRHIDQEITVGRSFRRKTALSSIGIAHDLERTLLTLNSDAFDDLVLGFAADGRYRQAADCLSRLPPAVARRVRRACGPCPPRPGFEPTDVQIGKFIYYVWGDFNSNRAIDVYYVDDENAREYTSHVFDPSRGLVYTDCRKAEFAHKIRMLRVEDVRAL